MTIFASVSIPPAPCGAWDCTGCQSVQHNEPNPILVAVGERMDLIDAYRGSVVSGDGTLPHLTIDPRHYDHARRVLTRLANLTKEN